MEEEEEEEEGVEARDAYGVLGLQPSCSHSQIKEAFRALAMATHPDTRPSPRNTARFIAISAAYQILSNPIKRAQYDASLSSQFHTNIHNQGMQMNSDSCEYRGKRKLNNEENSMNEEEVAEWLKWYRHMVVGMVYKQEIGIGTGFLECLQGELHIALKSAYLGPHINSMDILPECFEAEERSEPGVLDVLHLVHGRYHFGSVRQVPTTDLIDASQSWVEMIQNSKENACGDQIILTSHQGEPLKESSKEVLKFGTMKGLEEDIESNSRADLELHLFGKLVARATRTFVKQTQPHFDMQDEISVFLCSDNSEKSVKVEGHGEHKKFVNDMLLGRICGLRSTALGGSCSVYTPEGQRTHVLLQHRTPFVKHMRWFKALDDMAQLECRCTRASLPSSKFWIFEPRCDGHNVGGWYIETFGRNERAQATSFNKRRRRTMDCLKRLDRCNKESEWAGKACGLLHPSLYIMAAAYRTIDSESEKGKLWISSVKENPLLRTMASTVLWCKSKLNLLKLL